jgi:DNA-directed RNA polymerase subunit beta
MYLLKQETRKFIEEVIFVVHPVRYGNVERMNYSKIENVLDFPNLIEIQKDSYEWFIEQGLREVFESVSPIVDHMDKFVLEFVDYRFDPQSKYTVGEAKQRESTYSVPLRVLMRLINKETGEVKEQEIYMGEFPKMTEAGTFIINGAERVIVSQVVRSPSVYFEMQRDKSGKELYLSTMIPNRGAWIEFETDSNDVLSVRIDRTRKITATILLKALGYGNNYEIAELFNDEQLILNTLEKDTAKNPEEAIIKIYEKLRPGEPASFENARKLIMDLFFDPRRYDIARVGRYKFDKKLSFRLRLENKELARDVVCPETGEILASAGDVIKFKLAELFDASPVNSIYIKIDNNTELKVISNNTCDITYFFPDADVSIINEKVNYGLLKPILDMDISDEEKLKLIYSKKNELITKTVTVDDIVATIGYHICIAKSIGDTDDIDHLGNRRIRSVGELLQNQVRVGLSRLERVVRERMTIQQETDILTPQTLVNVRPVYAAMKEFFGSSQLSQFMDQTNPLAELTHKRRLSALGPGGLSRDRAGFEVRDVHHSHYGRMCPIETPEGPNIGLINCLSTYAKINKYGFMESPYRRIDKKIGVVTDEVVYLTADIEDNYVVAQATEPLDENNVFVNEKVTARFREHIIEVDRSKVDFMDVSPKQLVSVATAMIPFLENDDANRALMGSNMQRQAVPLLIPDSPIVGTGMEYNAAVDSGVVVVAEDDGTVVSVSSNEVSVKIKDGTIKTYNLIKFKRSNQGTCINQRPIVKKGDVISKGSVIADGPSTDKGETALGQNVLIGFMTWEGYNYEDAILINERLVREDIYTSIHIEKYEIESRDTKLGPEEITRDIPNVGEDALKDLDERGIIRIGAEVKPGDVLVGKVSPKGETELTSEERLLRAIFGEKAREVRDTSLRVPHGESGTIVEVNVFTRENGDEMSPGVNMIVRVHIAQKRKISVGDKVAGRHGNKGVISRILPEEDMPYLPDGRPLDIVLNPLGVPSRMNIGQVLEVHLGYAAKALGWKIATPVFDGAVEEDIVKTFEQAGIGYNEELLPEYEEREKEFAKEKALFEETKSTMTAESREAAEMDIMLKETELKEFKGKVYDGKTILFDGRSGEPFDNRVTVGYMYILKLHHLVDDKIHARSTGPYSLVTQQPLGGKAQFGGQRFGEMEVWALEAYGAAYTLQEILTVKSDDIVGRVKTYEAIVKGVNVPKPGVPESFKVLIKELQSLCLDMKAFDGYNNEINLKDTYEDDAQNLPTVIADEDDLLKYAEEHINNEEDDEDEIYEEISEVEIEDDIIDFDDDLEVPEDLAEDESIDDILNDEELFGE